MSTRASDVAALLVISACLALCICFVSANLNGRFEHRAEVVENQFAILHGQAQSFDGVQQPKPQFRSRILFPLALAALAELRMLKPTAWYLLLRIATAWIALAIFITVCMGRGASLKVAVGGAFLLCYSLVFTFNFRWEHPTDFIDVAVFSILLSLALQRRRWLFMLAVLLGITNHQTAALGTVIWFFVTVSRRTFVREVVYSGLVMILALATSFGISRALAHGEPWSYPMDGYKTLEMLRDALRHPNPFIWPVLLIAMLTPAALWLYTNRLHADRRLIWSAVIIVVLSSPIAYWSELRSIWVAPLIVVTFAATIAEGAVGHMLAHAACRREKDDSCSVLTT
jgi:multisubunit Na+/H+ antiporter MnhG subunit